MESATLINKRKKIYIRNFKKILIFTRKVFENMFSTLMALNGLPQMQYSNDQNNWKFIVFTSRK